MTTEWDDTAKAQWILENGPVPEIVWILERVGDQIYKRPGQFCKLPPWINKERQPVLNYTVPGYDIEDLQIHDHTRGRHDRD